MGGHRPPLWPPVGHGLEKIDDGEEFGDLRDGSESVGIAAAIHPFVVFERDGGRYLPLQDDIASVAYWYQTLPTASFPELPDKDYLEII